LIYEFCVAKYLKTTILRKFSYWKVHDQPTHNYPAVIYDRWY